MDRFPGTRGGVSHLPDSVVLLARVVHLVEVLASPPVERVYGRREGLPESREFYFASKQLVGEADQPVDWNAVIDQEFLPKDLQKPL